MLLFALATLVLLFGGTYVAFTTSPWPSALLIRRAFDAGAAQASQRLLPFLPRDVEIAANLAYDPSEPSLKLDVYYPRGVRGSLLTVLWIHGGAWLSGSKDDVAHYARILAARGFTVVAIDYQIAPAAQYPTPLRNVNAALRYLQAHARELHVAPDRIVLAGDSAGAQIAAQMANLVSVPSYAKRVGIAPALARRDLAGVLLYCGVYSLHPIGPANRFASFVGPVIWAYSGSKNVSRDPYFETASVMRFVTKNFPPAFISAGNGDPLLAQSRAFAAKLRGDGVAVDGLFFSPSLQPPLGHEYQFDLARPSGELALERSVAFLRKLWVQARP